MMGKPILLPVPIGKFMVGISHSETSYIDEDQESRRVPMTLFYPADDSMGKDPAPYAFEGAFPNPKMAEKAAAVETHCYSDLPLSSEKEKFPVLIFNHSYGGNEMQNTVLCSDLASRGYIIASLGHPGESSAVRYLDGTIEKISPKYIKEMSDPKLMESLRPLLDEFKAIPEEEDQKLIDLSRRFFALQECFSVRVKVWVADTIKAVDYLERLNHGEESSIFAHRLDLSLGIGLFGHSFGGSIVLQAFIEDPRFVCGINVDGGHFGDYFGQDVARPLLQIGNPHIWKMLKVVFLRNSEDVFHVTVEDADHLGFTDQIFFPRDSEEENRCGTRDAENFRLLLTDYHLAFFDDYLLKSGKVFKDLEYQNTRYYEKRKIND